jgi:peptidoglycan/LPS O-acetylase OafA/YrhL
MGPPFSPHIGHLWSLSAEVQFYVVWGVSLWWLLRRGVARGMVVGAVVALFAASWVERVVLWRDGSLWNRLYLGPDTRAPALLVGCVLGLAYAWGWMPPRRLLAVLVVPALAFGAWFVVEMSFLDGRTYDWALGVIALAWGALVASAVAGPPVPLRVVLELAPLAWLGRISYSVYLWHLPVIAEVAKHRPDDPLGVALLALPITLVVGTASYLLVERPLLSSAGRARVRAALG